MLIFISGFGGTGKDTILKKLVEDENLGLKKLVTYTTREPRENEVEGVDYHFVKDFEFIHKSYLGDWLEAREYNHVSNTPIVKYATPKYDDFETRYISCGSVDQAIKIKVYNKDKTVWVHLDSDPRTRINRMISRASSDVEVIEACRRLYMDYMDFKDVRRDNFNPDFIVDNGAGKNINDVVDEVASGIMRFIV